MRKRLEGPLMLLMCAAVCVWGISLVHSSPAAGAAGTAAAAPPILIDPGHGGMDPGAGAPDGTRESGINLGISLPLRNMLFLLGYNVEMTRDADVDLSAAGADSIREKKVSDMKNRLALYDAAGLVVSIHQNYFPQSQYSGTQIFYAPKSAESGRLGESIRCSVVGMLQPDNSREMKKAGSGIYLLSRSKVPAVLVECGFLSNPRELAKLKTPAYQQQMAFCIMSGIILYDPRY